MTSRRRAAVHATAANSRPAEARGSDDGHDEAGVFHITVLLKDRPLLIFLVCSVLFHFANAAMLPLLGEMISKGHGRAPMMFHGGLCGNHSSGGHTAGLMVQHQSAAVGTKALLLIAFGVLHVRGLLYTLANTAPSLVAIQIFDGVAAAVFGVVSVLVIADLTKGTGRFNLTLGAVTTAVGIGAALSQSVAGSIVHRWGYHAGFAFLAAVAIAQREAVDVVVLDLHLNQGSGFGVMRRLNAPNLKPCIIVL